MQRPRASIPVLVVLFVLFGGEGPPPVSADSCPGCSSNSAYVNSFPVRALRWGTSPVVGGTIKCPFKRNQWLAIQRLPVDTQKIPMRGYQLVVVDNDWKTVCEGLDVVGVHIELNRNGRRVVIQQMAKTVVTKHNPQLSDLTHREYRPVYFISAANAPDTSICTEFYEHWLGWIVRYVKRRFGSTAGDSDYLAQPADRLDDLFHVFADRLVEYAVIIPDASHAPRGNPVNPSESWTNLRPIPEAARAARGRISLEWFDLACAGDALAHTDLSGLVDLEEEKWVRTAALRMFLADYREADKATLDGTPIQYARDTRKYRYPSCHRCTTPTLTERGPIEAVWTEKGAACLTHSRLWLKDTVITAAESYNGSLEEREVAFRSQFRLPVCSKAQTGIFTSYNPNHIRHTPQFE
jgi:ADYC domain